MKKFISFSLLIISMTTITYLYANNASLTKMRNNNIRYIEYSFTDFSGMRKSLIKPASCVEEDLEKGIYFDGSSIKGCTRITNSDLLLKPSLDTMRLIPWTNDATKTVSLVCDMFLDKNTPYTSDPRFILKSVLNEAKQLGYDFFVGPELEFYIFKQKANQESSLIPFDNESYFENNCSCEDEVMKGNILNNFDALELVPEKIHHEVGPGQYEISLHYDNALKMADKIVTAKHALQAMGNSSNCYVSFMPKPLSTQNGSGMHIHFSLFDIQNQKNAFFDPEDKNRLSPIAKSFIAGILHHASALTLLFNPTINSYKRLVPGFEAPIFICAGTKNRSALIRLPLFNPDQAEAARAEIRSIDPTCNPYLAFAALLKAGLYGIQNNLQLDQFIEENLYEMTSEQKIEKGIDTIPSSLPQAIDAFERSGFLKELLGNHLFDEYIKDKKKEVMQSLRAITDWELKHYL
ncbi:MAG: type I glutamate--ammonia ligase [Candidatus Babeliales bacterium]